MREINNKLMNQHEINRNTHGGKRDGAGRKHGTSKVNKTFSLDIDVAKRKPNSKLVNDLLKFHYTRKPNCHNNQVIDI